MDFKLDYLLDEEELTFYLNKDTVKIGKLPANDLQLDDNSVSRNHCKLIKTLDGYKLKDLSSTNGTFVNGKKIQETALKEGDKITIGRTILKFQHIERKESYSDAGDQKISMVLPLLDEFRSAEGNEEVNVDLKLLNSLTDLGKKFIASSNLEESFQRIGDLIFEFLHPKRLFIFSYNENQGELILKHSHTGDGKTDEKATISKTIAMKAIREKVAILSNNAKDDARFNGAQSIIMYGITSAISAPIWTKSSIYGLLYMDTTKLDQAFKERDMEILSIIANFTGLAIEGFNSLNKLTQEKKIRSRLERYHSPAVVSRIMEMKDENSQDMVAYKEMEASVLFMDIVSFTTKVENMKPVECGVFLNNFFTEMTEIIFKHNGTLDKYIGDAIMATFGVPIAYDNHAELSILAALEMKKKLAEINQAQPAADAIQIRIGINCGRLIAGDFGSPKRIDFTVLGNTVNIASRLESSIAGPNDIAVSESVYAATKDKFIFEDLGPQKLSGISRQERVYKVLRQLEEK